MNTYYRDWIAWSLVVAIIFVAAVEVTTAFSAAGDVHTVKEVTANPLAEAV